MSRNAESNGRRRRQSGRASSRKVRAAGHEYLITFPAGLTELAIQCLQSDLQKVHIRYRDDSSAIISTTSTNSQVARLGYTKNAFQIILETPRSPLNRAAKEIARQFRRIPASSVAGLRPFRLMAQIDGHLESLERTARAELEQSIQRLSGAPVNARGGGDEIWLLGRRELATIVLGRRITHASSAGPKGSLGPELSELLVRLSRPAVRDVFLDPFSGSGSLPRARSKFPAKRIISNDLYVKPTLLDTKTAARIEVLREDACQLESVPDGAIDVIVTDPPWGEFEELSGEPDQFYDRVSQNLARILKPASGRLVILISRHGEALLTDALLRNGLTKRERISIVLNGHPAVVLRADRGGDSNAGE